MQSRILWKGQSFPFLEATLFCGHDMQIAW